MRIWDYRTAAGVDHFVANSRYIARRIRKVYGRHADVVYPPVDVERFSANVRKDDFYLAASRLVPYKRMDLVVRAFAAMPERRLVVIGDGPERDKLAAHATPNVELLGYQPFPVLKEMLERARALVFAAEEDFGIVPVEAQAAGTPVIALGKGGALETVRGLSTEKPTGVFFERQEVPDVIEAVRTFEAHEARLLPEHCRDNALRFSAARFREEFGRYVAERRAEFRAPRRERDPWRVAEAGE
jgi:glycosyltransferase involved in cell wall biosynthesis